MLGIYERENIPLKVFLIREDITVDKRLALQYIEGTTTESFLKI